MIWDASEILGSNYEKPAYYQGLCRAQIATVSAIFLLLAVWSARAEVKVAIERNQQPGPRFKFEKVPSPLGNDAGATAKFKVISGLADANSGALGVLNDGRLPEDEDDPASNFFFQNRTDGGRLVMDLGQIIAIKEINTYSWHPESRAPQVYTLYCSDGAPPGFDAEPKRSVDPEKCGWRRLARVDTRPSTGRAGGQYGVSIAESDGSLGDYRFLLFDIYPAETNDAFGNTFFSEIDVRARQPAEPEIPAKAHPMPTTDFNYTLEAAEAPDLQEWATNGLKPEIDKWYPIIRECLASDGFTAPKEFSITIKPMRGVAATGGTRVNVSAEWIRSQLKHPEWNEAIGSVIHELVHVVQQYHTRGNPGWLVEGVADYLRWFHFEPVGHRPVLRNPAKAKFSDSYKVTAGFLEYVVKNHDHELAVKLNAAMRQGRYSPEIWKDCTGVSLPDLWNEYISSLTQATASPEDKSDNLGQPERSK